MRHKSRQNNTLREIHIKINTNPFAEGSCIISAGLSKIICTASVDNKVPSFLKGKGSGWITAEYSMLPRATESRNDREAVKGKQTGRTIEIQRLISRSLRSVVDLPVLGEQLIKTDCDVITADAGTRTLAITGGFVALYLAINTMLKNNTIKQNPIKEFVAAVSCGILSNEILLDLDYSEDSKADIDANFIITENNNLVEVQASAEGNVFNTEQLMQMLELAKKGTGELIQLQKLALKDYL